MKFVTLCECDDEKLPHEIEEFVSEWNVSGPEQLNLKVTDKLKRFLQPGEERVSAKDLCTRVKKFYIDQLFLKRLSNMVSRVQHLNAPFDEKDRIIKEERK